MKWKVKVKESRPLVTFEDIFALFPGLEEQAKKFGVTKDSRVVEKERAFAWKVSCSVDNVVSASVVGSYPSSADALAGVNPYSSTLQLTITKSPQDDWIARSRMMYSLFYSVVVNSPLCYKGEGEKQNKQQQQFSNTF